MTIQELYDIFVENPSISTDSRSLKNIDIYWALKGEHFDGNRFVEQALKSGVKYAVSDLKDNLKFQNVIFVEDSLKTLQELARFHRKELNIPVIVITGTNGKTTTKELIAVVLSKKFKVGYTQGNLNNHIGVPLTILQFNKQTEIGVVEAGANHQGEIAFLCEIAQPDYGIITNIGKAHLEGFGSFENLIQTKSELYHTINNKGKIFINADNALLMKLAENKTIITYGTHKEVFCKGQQISANPYLTIQTELQNSILIHSKLVGQYNFENILAAVCIGKYFNIEDKLIKDAVENYIPQNNRSQMIQKGSNRIILDAYNANPSSMSVSIDNFLDIEAEKKIIILGDMFELGVFEEQEHDKILQKLILFKESFPNTEIFLAGGAFYKSLMRIKVKKDIYAFKSTDELILNLKRFTFSHSYLLIKGSRGMKMESILDHLNIS